MTVQDRIQNSLDKNKPPPKKKKKRERERKKEKTVNLDLSCYYCSQYPVCSLSLTTFCNCSVAQSCLTFCDPMMERSSQAPLSIGFSQQEYWGGLPFPPPGDLPNAGIGPTSPASPHSRQILDC